MKFIRIRSDNARAGDFMVDLSKVLFIKKVEREGLPAVRMEFTFVNGGTLEITFNNSVGYEAQLAKIQAVLP